MYTFTSGGNFFTPLTYSTNLMNNLGASQQSQNFCSQFNGIPCNEPEPYASLVDVTTASQFVENAIHAPDVATATNQLNMAMTWLQHAYNYFVTAQMPAFQARTQQVMNVLANIINQLQTTSNLKMFQDNVMYGFMGVLAALYKDINTIF